MARQFLVPRTSELETLPQPQRFTPGSSASNFVTNVSLRAITPNAGISDAIFNQPEPRNAEAGSSPHGIKVTPIPKAEIENLPEGASVAAKVADDPLRAGMLVHAVLNGQGNFSVVGTPKFRNAVTRGLLDLASTPTGRRMIEALLVSAQKTVLTATDFHDRFNDDGDNISDHWYQRQGRVQGRRIRFNPGRSAWVEKAPEDGSAAPQRRAWELELALAHEISHSLHDLIGGNLKANFEAPPSHDKYTDREEELAIAGRQPLPKVPTLTAGLDIFTSGFMADAANAVNPTFSENQVARELGHTELRQFHEGVTDYRGEHLETVRALVAYEQLSEWCADNPAASAPESAEAIDQICDRALNNFYIDDAVIEATRVASRTKLGG